MRPYFVLSVALAALSFASAASAHETIPENWCVDTNRAPKIIVSFQFDGSQLQALVDKCGIVDEVRSPDHWTQATLAIGEYCKGVAPPRDEAVPFISGPRSYGTTTHHGDYRLYEGLVGVCVVCPTR